jgi:hypothetical protein
VILPGLDGSFGRVAAVAVWRDSLEIDMVFLERLLSSSEHSLLRM